MLHRSPDARQASQHSDPVGSLEVGEHQDVEQVGAGSGSRRRGAPAVGQEERPLGWFLASIEEGRWSWTWHVAEDVRRNAVRELRPWAEERYGPLDRIEENEVERVWRAYDLPA